MRRRKKKHVGSTLTSFLDEAGIRAEVDAKTAEKVARDERVGRMIDRVMRDHAELFRRLAKR